MPGAQRSRVPAGAQPDRLTEAGAREQGYYLYMYLYRYKDRIDRSIDMYFLWIDR